MNKLNRLKKEENIYKERGNFMPNIKPISDLKNYDEVLRVISNKKTGS